jgi:WD40 repeat protein
MDSSTSILINPSPRVFISYARTDGEYFTSTLRDRLTKEEPEITLWQDRMDMEGGVGWWRQITDALESVEFLVLVMTPAAMRSPIVQKEWRYARQQGVCVYPVKGVPDTQMNFENLPRWIRKAHFFDLEKEWQTFVNYLKSPPRISRVCFMAPDMPANFVSRPEVLEPVIQAIVDEKQSSVTLTTTLQGAGGLGKTTMAIAICHNETIIESFDDGILWATLGKEPKLAEELARLYTALTGKRPAFINQDDAEYHLSQVLEEKNCLIVIDDVWHIRHLKPFLRGGKKCVRLITTRIAEVATNTHRVIVDVMSSSEAQAMLCTRLSISIHDKRHLRRLAHHLGEWPLILELANAQLRRRVEKGDTLPGAIDYLYLKLEKQGILAFDLKHATDRQEAISRTIDLSLEMLSPEEAELFTFLAVFPEDIDIPLEVAAALWGLDEFSAEELAQLLDDISLANFSIQAGSIRLHDVIGTYLGIKLSTPAQLHSRLADLLALPSLKGSSYAWGWMPFHLVNGGRISELRSTLQRIDWLTEKLMATDVASLVEDFGYFSNDPNLELIQEAIKLAGPALAGDPLQLAGQILARLPKLPEYPGLVSFRESVASWRAAFWLEPYESQLTPTGGPMVSLLFGHQGPVLDVACTIDDSKAISCSADGTLRVWDWLKGRLLRTNVHVDWVRAIAVLPDGNTVISASDDGYLRWWDIDDGKLISEVPAHSDRIVALACVAQDSLKVAGATGCEIKTWAMGGEGLPHLLGRHSGMVTGLIQSSTNSLLSCSEDRRIGSFDPINFQPAVFLREHAGIVICMAASSNCPVAVSASSDGSLICWELENGSVVRHKFISLQAFYVSSIAVSSNGRFAYTGFEDGSIIQWDLESGAQVKTLKGHTAAVNKIALTGNGHFAISASDDHTLRIWELSRNPIIQRNPLHADHVRTLLFTPDGTYVLSSSDLSELIVWNASKGTECSRVKGSRSWLFEVPDDKSYVAMSMAGNHLQCWPIDVGNIEIISRRNDLRAIHYNLDANTKILIDILGKVSIWDLTKKACVLRIALDPEFAREAVFSADGKHLVLWATNARFYWWNLQKYAYEVKYIADSCAFAISADGAILAVGSEDGSLCLIRRGSPSVTLQGHSKTISSISFSSESHFMISVGEDNKANIWELGVNQPIAGFTFDLPPVSCALSPNAQVAVVGDVAGQVHFFRLHLPAELNSATSSI